MTSWQAHVTFIGTMSEDDAFDIMEKLGKYGAVTTVERDFSGGSVTLSIEADTTLDAASGASRLVSEAVPNPITITGLEVVTETEAHARLGEPLFPEVVSFAEIGTLAGVSRQRARQFSENPAFPKPVITTAQGPLYGLHAVKQWLDTRNTRPGRPARATA